MSIIRSKEFVNFCNSGKKHIYGNLTMIDDSVYSYNMLIAKIDRPNKKIFFNSKKVSRTTSAHQSAISKGFYIFLESQGWKMEDV